jgi:hypothetical protein
MGLHVIAPSATRPVRAASNIVVQIPVRRHFGCGVEPPERKFRLPRFIRRN